ncbi:MAG: 4-hydroxybenzoyl-CoA thioesterase [Burkholderiales bacterium PBB6]|nr:MAG: 4-hydroxybenzoyl-CoA thioesterase [Burkholderiales bacterium PBB6]
MNKSSFRFTDRLRVRWAEVDMQQIVFNGHYLLYIDTAMGAYWRALALPYQATMAAFDGDLYVRKATLEYHASALYDDTLDVGIKLRRIGSSSLTFDAGVWRGSSLLVSGELVYVFANPQTRQPTPVPETLRAVLEGHEAGAPMLQLALGHWGEHEAASRQSRDEVFVEEQGIAAHLMVDEADAGAMHAVATNALGRAVGSGRLVISAPGEGKIGRMAVVRALRGTTVGRQLLQALIAEARRQNLQRVWLQAQTDAQRFYEHAGFVARGDVYMEAGVSHIDMHLNLASA